LRSIKWPRICSVSRNQIPSFPCWVVHHRVCNKSNTIGVTCEVRISYPSGAPEFTLRFSVRFVLLDPVFCVLFCRSLFVLFILTIVLSLLFYLRFLNFLIFPMLVWDTFLSNFALYSVIKRNICIISKLP